LPDGYFIVLKLVWSSVVFKQSFALDFKPTIVVLDLMLVYIIELKIFRWETFWL